MTRGLALLMLLFAAPVQAQSVGDCGAWTSAQNLPEPWSEHTATYAGGQIRVALLDTMVPAAAALHLLVLSPPLDGSGGRQCRTVSLAGPPAGNGWPTGFQNIDFAGREAARDSARGLVLTFPVEAYDPARDAGDAGELTVTINQSSGEITAMVAAE